MNNEQTAAVAEIKISIVIPVYNGAAFLRKCLGSVYDQTERRLEIVIVDDASSDESLSVEEELREACPNTMSIKLVRHERSLGVSAARNSGVKKASGEFLFFMDADDWLSPDCLKELLHLAETHDADVSCGSFDYYFDGGGNRGLVDGKLDFHIYESNSEILRGYTEHRIPVFLWNKLVRRSFWDKARLRCEESVSNDEDQLWIFRVVLNATRWVSSEKTTYFYRKDNPNSITALSMPSRRLDNYLTIMDFMKKEVEQIGEIPPKKARWLAKVLLTFSKSVLWHIELDQSADHRMLFTEFRKKNLISPGGHLFRALDIKEKVMVLGWSWRYPFCRWSSPYYLSKLIHGRNG